MAFVVLTNSINNVVIITDFVINQDFIAKTLCIQKDDQKGCNGKCQLTKELVQNNTDSNSDTPKHLTDPSRLDVFILTATIKQTVNNFSNVSNLKNTFDFRLKQPISGFYDIETPPPNLS
ncbi:hypothetical protein [Winogradskyella vidalii]|uniref:hypothetical protein n=1 Tax=Winogradskyella vidalii TaxID=2615024 RepID=UPI0015C98B45|nr:hypothetical protein [Winogradskyella vidalii]